ncbi:hypothetical protein [Helcococcus ovis]|uniref:hypothetical protein n=1 Tax=Helcococcus ovis TaxID=72026 RepID=UPI00107056A7|nr:hypothetical protein [Helcococcus ovis]TFF65829.1 hypothetical protein EQF93_07880 [Helcococcus ovis]WNZ00742.1 hypothetical protein EQF90_005635 [Helcococcus ovis]
MEITLNNHFNDLSIRELDLINAGGWAEAGYAIGGTLLIAGAPIVATLPGAGWYGALGMLGEGITLLGKLKK